MAVLFMDPFDEYNTTTDFLLRWSSVTNAGATTVGSSGNGRMGTNSLRMASGNSATKILPSTYACLITHVGYRPLSLLDGAIIVAYQDGSTLQCELRVLANGKLRVTRNNTTLATSNNVYFQNNVYHHVQFKATINNTGSFYCKVDNDTVTWDIGSGNDSIDTQNTANANADRFTLGGFASITADWDDLYITDGSGANTTGMMGDVRLQALFASGAGSHTDWTPNGAGSNFQCVDESPPNSDTDYISSSTTNQIDTYAFGDLSPTAGSVLAVEVLSFARKDDAGTRTIAPVIRTGSTDAVGTSVNLSTSYAFYSQIFETNPANGSAAWTVSDVNSSEFGAKLL